MGVRRLLDRPGYLKACLGSKAATVRRASYRMVQGLTTYRPGMLALPGEAGGWVGVWSCQVRWGAGPTQVQHRPGMLALPGEAGGSRGEGLWEYGRAAGSRGGVEAGAAGVG